MPERWTIAMEGVGALLVVGGIAAWSWRAALVVAGLLLITAAFLAKLPPLNPRG